MIYFFTYCIVFNNNFIYYWFFFLLNYVLLFIIFFLKSWYFVSKNILIYKEVNLNFSNSYFVLMKIFFCDKPKLISFFIFYNFSKIFKNKDFLIFLKNGDIFVLFYNLLFRILIIALTSTPFIFLKANTFFILKLTTLYGLSYESLSALIDSILYNILYSMFREIEVEVKKYKIIFNKDTIEYNPSTEFWKGFLKRLAGLDKFNKVSTFVKNRTNLLYIRHKKGLDLDLKKPFHTKSHLTLIIRLPNGIVIYLNETSKNELMILDTKTNTITFSKLNYSHESSLNKDKITYYTKNVQTNESNIIVEKDINTMKLNFDVKNNIHDNMLLAFFLNSDEPVLETKFIESENKFYITKNSFDLDIIEKLKLAGYSNNQLTDSFYIINNFLKQNENILNQIPLEEKSNFIKFCLERQYHENFSKDLIFLILKN